MDMNEKPKLSGVPETMLQTVYARAKETKTRGAIKDTKAVEIIDKINYDFSLADKDSAMRGGDMGVGAEKYRYRKSVSVGVSKRSKLKFITHKRKI